MKLPELLAPASGPAEFRAALAGGADAVYLGLKRFNARRRAQNFTLGELEQAVHDARRAEAKIYLTFNTLLFDGEWRRAARLLGAAWERGVDALIVQDWGVIEWARRNVPGMPLHASTQMTVHHPSQLEPLAGSGVERVIVARELTLAEVEKMAARATGFGIGVEVFVHGALCVAYSGQCLMSSLMEGRSGNRGLCAQLCRRAFRKESPGRRGRRGKTLSMKDLSALPILPDLIRSGAASLKIEGRLKRPEYVTEVVSVYREALDRIGSGRSATGRGRRKGKGGASTERLLCDDLTERLEMVFNRGFGTGGLEGPFRPAETTGQRGGPRFPRLGTVVKIDRRRSRLLVRLEREPAPGDGVALFPIRGGAPTALVVTRLFDASSGGRWIGVKSFDSAGLAGCPERGELYLSSSAEKMRRIREAAARYELPRVGVRLQAAGAAGEPLRVSASTACGWRAEAMSETALAPAARKELDGEVLASHLGRMGGTAFMAEEVRSEAGKGLFLPLKEINALRRRIVASLEAQRTARRAMPVPPKPQQEETAARQVTVRETEIVLLCSWEQAGRAFDAGADRVYCTADAAVVSDSGRPAEGRRPWLRIPAVTPSRLFEAIEEWLKSHGRNLEGIVAGHAGAMRLARHHELPVWADTSFNIMNRLACAGAARFGVEGVVLSWELGPRRTVDLADRSPLPLEAILLGRPPLMHTSLRGLADLRGEACLKDDDGRHYPLRPWAHGDGATVAAPGLRDWSRHAAVLAGRAARLRLDLREVDGAAWPGLVGAVRETAAGRMTPADLGRRFRKIVPQGTVFL